MSNRLISEDSIERLNELIEQVKEKAGSIEIELENDCKEAMWRKYEGMLRSLNSILWQLEDKIKYL